MIYLHLILVVFFLALADINYEKEYNIHIGIAHTRWATHGEPRSVKSQHHRQDPNKVFCMLSILF
jgi:glucosamine--fructose-6-phosphate aminotransferase (isomerizing)